MLRRLAPLLAALALAGCGGGPDAKELLGSTAGNLAKIRSGVIDVRATAPVSVRVHGSFRLVPGDRLPVVDIRAGGRRFRSDGRRAWIADGDARVPLASSEESLLGSLPTRLAGAATLLRLSAGSYVQEPHAGPGPTIGGVATDEVTGRVDADALGLQAFGLPSLPPGSVRSLRLVLDTGKHDRILRRLVLQGVAAGEPFRLVATLTRVNER